MKVPRRAGSSDGDPDSLVIGGDAAERLAESEGLKMVSVRGEMRWRTPVVVAAVHTLPPAVAMSVTLGSTSMIAVTALVCRSMRHSLPVVGA